MHFTVFQYPLVIRQVDIWTVISIPDLKISQVEDGPHKGVGQNILSKSKAIAKTIKEIGTLKN